MMDKKDFKNEIEHELKEGILKYWIKNTIDDKNGGFIGEINYENEKNYEASKGSIVNFRLLWTFATAYRIYKEDLYLSLATRAYNYIINYFIDNQYGGVFWELDHKGEPINSKKQTYAQAFAIYGFAQYYRATKDEKSLEIAKNQYKLIERYSYDSVNEGYFEGYTQDWGKLGDQRLSDKEPNLSKTMNTNLHVLEALTELYRNWKNEKLKEQLKKLIIITKNKIVNQNNFHFNLYFDNEWNSQNDIYSYGHDIEGSWLLYEAAEILGDKNLLSDVRDITIKMADAVFEEGLDKDGSLLNEGENKQIIDYEKHWWVQAENIVGFYNAYQITKDIKYYNAVINNWEFIKKYQIDKKYGGWHYLLHKDNTPDKSQLKIGLWKCPYHNSRMAFEILERN